MAVQTALHSHAGEKMVAFILDADEKLCAPVSNFLGLKVVTAGRIELHFEKSDGTYDSNIVTLNVDDTGTLNGIGVKRAIEAITIAMGNGRPGKYVKIADSTTSEFIHPEVLGIQTIA